MRRPSSELGADSGTAHPAAYLLVPSRYPVAFPAATCYHGCLQLDLCSTLALPTLLALSLDRPKAHVKFEHRTRTRPVTIKLDDIGRTGLEQAMPKINAAAAKCAMHLRQNM
jgi:hypothetical protein